MGLDMYLYGDKSRFRHSAHPDKEMPSEDGFRVHSTTLSIGYWRKHPNLHGYIVQNFADGKDECQRIPLTADDLRKIRDAVFDDKLPDTSGFFFGQSARPGDDWYDNQLQHDNKVLTDAINWLEAEQPEDEINYRQVYYEASW